MWLKHGQRRKKLDVAEMRMLRWTYDVTKMDRIRNENSKKVQERRLKWYGHVMRRHEECAGKRVLRIDVEEKERKTRVEVDG